MASEFEGLLTVAAKAARAGGAVLRPLFDRDDLEIRQKEEHDFVTEADHASEDVIVDTIRAAFPDHEVLGEERGLDRTAASSANEGAYRWLVDPLDGTTNFLQGLPVFAVSVACQFRGRSVAAAIHEPMTGRLFTAAEGGGARCSESGCSEPGQGDSRQPGKSRRLRVSTRPGLPGAFLATGYPFRTRQALDTYLEVFRDVFRVARAVRRCGAAALDLAYTAAGVFDGFFEFRLSPWDFAAGELLIREAGGVITDLDGESGFYDAGNLVCGPPGVHAELLAAIRRHVDESAFRALLL